MRESTGEDDVFDTKAAKIVREYIGLAVVFSGLIAYHERRAGLIEFSIKGMEAQSEHLERRVAGLEVDAASRVGIAADGGFKSEAVRAMVSRQFELEAKRLRLFDEDSAKRWADDIKRAVLEAVAASKER